MVEVVVSKWLVFCPKPVMNEAEKTNNHNQKAFCSSRILLANRETRSPLGETLVMRLKGIDLVA